jgi:hypothetical protein
VVAAADVAAAAGVSQLVEGQPVAEEPHIKQLLDPEEWQVYVHSSDFSNLSLSMLAALTSNSGFLINREIMLHTWLSQVAANVHQVQLIKLQAAPFGGCWGWGSVVLGAARLMHNG